MKRSQDKFWSLAYRTKQCLRFRKASHEQNIKLKRIRQLRPGKQGTVDLEQDTKTGIKVVVKRSEITGSVAVEKSLHRRHKLTHKHPWGTQPMIEHRVGKAFSEILQKGYCPNLVFQYEQDIGISEGRLFTVLEAFDGDLYHLLKSKKGKLSNDIWYSMWFQICAGLIAMHRNGVQHTDLHLSNIFFKKIPATKSSKSYWRYKIGTKTYWVPNTGYIFAVGDYGRARSVAWKTKFERHDAQVTKKLKDINVGWASYDYYRLHTRSMRGYMPTGLHAEFDKCPRHGAYPVEKAVHAIFQRHFGKRPTETSSGTRIESYNITKRIKIRFNNYDIVPSI